MQPHIFPLERFGNPLRGDAPFLNRLPASPQTTPDTWAFVTQSKVKAYYRGSYSAVMGAADEAFPQTGVYMTASTTSRAQPNYTSPRSAALNSFDNSAAALDQWAQVTFGRALPFYSSARAITISVFDPATNTFADWTPAALLSRSVANYSPPKAQAVVAWGQSVITDQIALGALSRIVGLYTPPRAQTIPVFDPATNTFSDWAPSPVVSSQMPRTLVRSWTRLGIYGPADSIAVVAQSRASTPLREPLSVVSLPLVAVVAPDTAALTAISRGSGFYAAPRSVTLGVFDNPAVVADAYAAVFMGRSIRFYRGSYSAFMGAADADITPTFGTDWVRVFQSRQLLRGVARISRVIWTPGVIGTPPVVPPVEPVLPPISFAKQENQGGGGEWIIWERPDFPGNRGDAWKRFPTPPFRRPTRREKRGY